MLHHLTLTPQRLIQDSLDGGSGTNPKNLWQNENKHNIYHPLPITIFVEGGGGACPYTPGPAIATANPSIRYPYDNPENIT